MDQVINFTDMPVNRYKMYGGKSCKKFCITIDDLDYMLKFPPKRKRNIEMGYTHACACEYIGSKIFAYFGIETQQTLLGTYGNNIAVACKDFETDGFRFIKFAALKNITVSNSNGGYDTDLHDILNTIRSQELYPSVELESFFWEMFVVDAYIGNFNRHNESWGFLLNDDTKEVKLAPVFNCDSSLYPGLVEDTIVDILNSREEINRRLYEFPISATKINDEKLSYSAFLLTTDNTSCIDAIIKIGVIDTNRINAIIEKTPLITNAHKAFLKFMLKERKKQVINPALNRAISLQKNKIPAAELSNDGNDFTV
ncbi:MAG: CtkA family protein [Oscillospiraceae bacterium]|jgi:hypothetical protein|nr:CtkA family protein [Oscillospiraceae bacterium]